MKISTVTLSSPEHLRTKRLRISHFPHFLILQILSRNPPTGVRPGARPAYKENTNSEKMKAYDHVPNGIQNHDPPGVRSMAQPVFLDSYYFVNTAYNHVCTHITISSTTHEGSFLLTGVSSTPLSRNLLDHDVMHRQFQKARCSTGIQYLKTLFNFVTIHYFTQFSSTQTTSVV